MHGAIQPVMKPNEDLDPIRRLILERATEKGLSLNELSRIIRDGRNPAYVYQFIYRGSPKDLNETMRQRVSVVLNIPEEQLRREFYEKSGWQPPPPRIQPVRKTIEPGTGRTPYEVDLTLPVLTKHRPVGGRTLPKPMPDEMILRPMTLHGVDGAFAVRMRTDFFRPQYKLGDVLYFHPGEIPRIGDGIVIELDDGEMIFGILKAQTTRKMTLTAYNPAADESFDPSRIMQVWREIGVKRH